MKALVSTLIMVAALITLATVEQFTFPLAKLTVGVSDEAGASVDGAIVKMTFKNPVPNPKDWGTGRGNKIVTARTDASGFCTLTDHCDGELGGAVQKEGYYRGWWVPYTFHTSIDNKWQPWNPTVTVVLKKIINPIPMYARRLETEMPLLDAPVGFDLVELDWVTPNGRGQTSDFVFKLTKRVESFHDFSAELVLSFSNQGDGIQTMPESTWGGSELRSPHSGPESGYSPSISLLQGNSTGGGEYGTKNNPRDYFFRVRTGTDSKGEVVSALYGKIYGSIEYFPVSYKTAKLRFTYYVNPTPSDRNLEFDPKHNLFTNLKPEERVTAP